MIFSSPVPQKACTSRPFGLSVHAFCGTGDENIIGSRCVLFAGQVMKISYPPVVKRVRLEVHAFCGTGDENIMPTCREAGNYYIKTRIIMML